MRLRPGPSRRAAGGDVRPREYYGELKGAIILWNGPSPSAQPKAFRPGPSGGVLQNGRQWCAERSSIGRQSTSPALSAISRVGKPQAPTPRGPNDYPNPRVFRGRIERGSDEGRTEVERASNRGRTRCSCASVPIGVGNRVTSARRASNPSIGGDLVWAGSGRFYRDPFRGGSVRPSGRSGLGRAFYLSCLSMHLTNKVENIRSGAWSIGAGRSGERGGAVSGRSRSNRRR